MNEKLQVISPKEADILRTKASLLDDLLFGTPEFETDEEINGANFIDGFARWRECAVARISSTKAAHEDQ